MLKPALALLCLLVCAQTRAATPFADIPHYGELGAAFHDAKSAQPGPAPTMILLGGSEGGIWPEDAKEVTELQAAGYNVATIAYFGMDGVPENLSRIRVDSFGEALELLKNNPKVNPRCIGVMGVSKGGELTLLLSSLYPDIRLAVAIVASDVVFQSSEATSKSHSSWTYQGKELPFVPYKLWSGAGLSAFFSAVTGMGDNYLPLHQQALDDNPERVKAATIAVEKINGPVLFVSGTQDQYWPATMMSERANQRLKAANFAHPHAHYSYAADHYVLDYKGLPTQADAPRLAPWPAIRSFMDTHLGNTPACKR